MNNHAPLPRALRDPLLRAAKTMLVVAITGARQTGKRAHSFSTSQPMTGSTSPSMISTFSK